MSRRVEAARRGRRVVGAGLTLFALSQALVSLVAESARPDLRDPSFGSRLRELRAQLRERPGKPLVLALGSSRVESGFLPDELGLPDDWPVTFNYGQPGAGPALQALTLRRLQAAGVRPDRLLIEVMPALLADPRTVPDVAPVERLSWGEWRAAGPWPASLDRRWLESRLAPIHTWRFSLMSRLAPSFLPWAARLDYLWDGLDRCGAVRLSPDCARPEVRARGLLRAAGEYRELLAHYAIAPESDRALRQLLDECRREQTRALVVVMPEGETFRGWYPPAARAAIDTYLADLRRDYGVAVLDARTWIGELDFYDGHHLLPAGAAAFSRRLGVVARSFLLGEGDAAGPVR
jgi:hypothetical protein